MVSHLAVFAAVSTLLILAPGPDTALIARNALLGGGRAALYTTLGVVAGLALWTLAASAGLAALLKASEPAFLALKIVGATYLVLLGAQALRLAVRGDGGGAHLAAGAPRIRPGRALRQGLFSNLGNPKIAIFFTSFLPQFAPRGASFLALLALGLVFCALALVWLTGYGALVARAGDVMRRPRVKRSLDGLTGAVLIGFGVRLATEHR